MSTIKQLALRFRWIFLGLLCIPAAISLKIGIHGAIHSGTDFQWSGAYLLRQGIDPWNNALLRQSTGIAHDTLPTSLHMFYVLLLPLSKMSFHHAALVWCFVNILLSIAAIYLLKNLFSLSRYMSSALLLLLWMSAPYRATLRLGQASLFELVLLCIVFCTTNSTLRGLALGFSFSQYSFAPVVVSFLWFKHNIRTLTIAAIVAVLAMMLTWSMLGGPVLQVAFEPFAIANLSPRAGIADLMTSLETGMTLWLPSFKSAQMLSTCAGLLASGAYGLFLSRRRISNGAYLALIAVASLFTIRHLLHDFVFLLVPLCYVFSERGKSMRLIAVPIVAVFWFMDGLFPPLAANAVPSTDQWITTITACFLLATLAVYLTWSILRIERAQHVVRSGKDRRIAQRREAISAF